MDKVELPLLKGKEREKGIPISITVGLIALIIFFIIGCLSLTVKSTYKLHYSESSNLDYKVFLKENSDFDKKYYTKSDDASFLSSLINYIDTDFNYTFKSAENIGMEYTYYVDAVVRVDGTDGKNLWKKTENVLKRKTLNDMSSTMFKINENVKIEYDKYNTEATDFMTKYKVTGDAYVEVNLYVDVVGKHSSFDKKISDRAVMTMKVPLNVKAAGIDLDYDVSNSGDEVLQYQSTIISNPVLFCIALFLSILDLLGVIAIVSWIIKNRDNSTRYQKKLNKILRDNDKLISETIITERVEDMMKTRSLRIEVIKDFESLMDIRDNLDKPILYHEERPGEEAVFYIINDRVGYIYVMRVEDMGKDA